MKFKKEIQMKAEFIEYKIVYSKWIERNRLEC